MNKLARGLLALAVFITSLEAVSREAEPPDLNCPADAPCTGPQLVALPPDGPDDGIDAAAEQADGGSEWPRGSRSFTAAWLVE